MFYKTNTQKAIAENMIKNNPFAYNQANINVTKIHQNYNALNNNKIFEDKYELLSLIMPIIANINKINAAIKKGNGNILRVWTAYAKS